ncbi:MAG: hypothetical protein ACOCY0_04615 [Roseicyclus sp.]
MSSPQLRPLLKADELAELLGYSRARLGQILPALYDQGFPRPLPGFAGRRWDPVAIDRWLATQRGDTPPADWSHELAQRLDPA